MLELAVLVEVANLKGLREILSQKVRGPRLQRLTVSHHRFNRVRNVRAGKLLGIDFFPGITGIAASLTAKSV